MWILIGLAVLTAVFWTVAVAFFDAYSDGRFAFGMVAIAAGFLLCSGLILLPVQRMGCDDTLAQIEAVRNTRPASEWQDAAWRSKAADANAELASMKYWKSTAFGLWIPDRVLAVKPIQ